MPGRRTRKDKAPEAGTRLAYWRNQKVREADAWGMQLEVGEVGRGQIQEGLVGPVGSLDFTVSFSLPDHCAEH